MKKVLFISFILVSQQFWGQEIFHFETKITESKCKLDSTFINYYVKDFSDTVWFTKASDVIKCNYLVKLEKSHNNCLYATFKAPMNGYFTIQTKNYDMSNLYQGTLINGQLETGTYTSFYSADQIYIMGQYQNNWKIGFWTTFRYNGLLDSVNKFIEGANDPVVVYKFDEYGNILSCTDEEIEILRRIEQNK